MSAFSLLPDKIKSSGAKDFLAKPFAPADLFERVVRLTEARPVSNNEEQRAREAGPFKILIADDDVIARRSLEATLTKWGYQVVSASGGAEALRLLLSDTAPELAILDWMMPDIEGVEICRRLRSRVNASYTYVMLLTAKTEKTELVEAMNAGADDFIVKPFFPDELKVRLAAGRRLLGIQARPTAVFDYGGTAQPRR
jgi:DNA-binding response OmpR family regulator